MTGFPYSEEGAITSIALGPLSSERWEPFLLVLSFTRIREKKKKEGRRKRKKTHTHTKPQPLSGVVEGGPVSRQRSLPQPCADGQTGSVCTKGKPWTAVLDLKRAAKAIPGEVPGHCGMLSLGLDHTWLKLPPAHWVGPGSSRKDQCRGQVRS